MATLIKTPSVNLEIDNGLDHGSVFSRDELIAMLAVLEADIKTKQKERDELRQYAVDAGEAQWKLSNDGKPARKAPAMGWWTTHRAASFEKQCDATEDPKHPEHSCFWAKPRKTFVI